MISHIHHILARAAILLIASNVLAQQYQISSFTLATGGASRGIGYAMDGGISHAGAGNTIGGSHVLHGGFWSHSEGRNFPAEVVFDNLRGGMNGVAIGNPTTRRAARICLDTEPHWLDSVTLIMYTRQPQTPVSLRLEIYTSDLANGKPLHNADVVMELSGSVNPIIFYPTDSSGLSPVKWKPSAPFLLPANQCWWVVLIVESGEVLVPSTSAPPKGFAGAFGRSQSQNGGLTWEVPDFTSNYMMLIEGIAVEDFGRVPLILANRAIAIPNGFGNFSSFPFSPSLSGGNLLFHGTGTAGQAGLYFASPTQPNLPTRVVDLNTPIPQGIGNFISLGTEAGIIIVSGNNTIFSGSGPDGQRGIYAMAIPPSDDTSPLRVADTATPIPEGIGTFSNFPHDANVSGDNVVFSGNGSSGQTGLYATILSDSQIAPLYKIADNTTPIPEGIGNFTGFPQGIAVNGTTTAFAATGTDGQNGVYASIISPSVSPSPAPSQASAPFRIADTATTIPGGVGTFQSLGTEAGIIIVSGKTVVFGGSGSGGRKGLYGASFASASLRVLPTPSSRSMGPRLAAEDVAFIVDPPFLIADTSTPIPDGSGNFEDFGAITHFSSRVYFLGRGSLGQAGIYEWNGVDLRSILSVGETIHGKWITDLNMSAYSLSDGNSLAVQATFSDGTDAVFAIELPMPSVDLEITEIRSDGTHLLLSFTTSPGESYAVESSPDPGVGTWTEVTDMTIIDDGDQQQVMIPMEPSSDQQFYRIKR